MAKTELVTNIGVVVAVLCIVWCARLCTVHISTFFTVGLLVLPFLWETQHNHHGTNSHTCHSGQQSSNQLWNYTPGSYMSFSRPFLPFCDHDRFEIPVFCYLEKDGFVRILPNFPCQDTFLNHFKSELVTFKNQSGTNVFQI